MIKRLQKILITGLALSVASFVFIIIQTNSNPWTEAEIKQLVTGLNEAAAIGVPHGYLISRQERAAHEALLQKVEAGDILTAEESIVYRHIYQKILRDSQSFLSMFDAELTIIPDHNMTMPNNVLTMGIVGLHDHHDTSARANFSGLLQSLQGLDHASDFLMRIYYANAAQKDLVDLISHMGVAPHTVSVVYVAPEKPWTDIALGDEYEAMMMSFKAAQFQPVNSPSYWAAVDVALAHYGALILAVQKKIQARTSSLERKVAGRFLSLQTMAPPVDLHRPLRRK
jgi:hypothetical protein